MGRFFGTARSRQADAARHNAILRRAHELESRTRNVIQREFEQQFQSKAAELKVLRQRCLKGNVDSIRLLMLRTHTCHHLRKALFRPIQFDLDGAARVALCAIEVPDFAHLSIVRKRSNSGNWLPVSNAERKRLRDAILYALCLRAAYLIANFDAGIGSTIALNATQIWHDPATGSLREGVIASLQASKTELLQLQLERLDVKACFRCHVRSCSERVFGLADANPHPRFFAYLIARSCASSTILAPRETPIKASHEKLRMHSTQILRPVAF